MLLHFLLPRAVDFAPDVGLDFCSFESVWEFFPFCPFSSGSSICSMHLQNSTNVLGIWLMGLNPCTTIKHCHLAGIAYSVISMMSSTRSLEFFLSSRELGDNHWSPPCVPWTCMLTCHKTCIGNVAWIAAALPKPLQERHVSWGPLGSFQSVHCSCCLHLLHFVKSCQRIAFQNSASQGILGSAGGGILSNDDFP